MAKGFSGMLLILSYVNGLREWPDCVIRMEKKYSTISKP